MWSIALKTYKWLMDKSRRHSAADFPAISPISAHAVDVGRELGHAACGIRMASRLSCCTGAGGGCSPAMRAYVDPNAL